MTDKVQKIREELERLREQLQDKVETSDFIAGEVFIMNYFLTFINSLQEEPVSEELEEAADCYKDMVTPEDVDDYEHAYFYETYTEYQIADAFKAGAKWKEEQFEKNRLKHCNSITNEQAEL